MNEKAIRTLEFYKIHERLANFTSFSASREKALSLLPSNDYEEVIRLQKGTSEARRLLQLNPGFTIGGARDVRSLAHRAALGSTLDPSNLLDIQATLASARTVHSSLGRLVTELPTLSDITSRIEDLPQIEAAIGRCIGSQGEILDRASLVLTTLRKNIKSAHQRLVEKVKEALDQARTADLVQDPIITQRDDRYVIPIKSEFKGQFKGIVHDVSLSGATVFMEPLAVVDLGNQLREFQLEEKREVERILRQLTAQVGNKSEAIIGNVESLSEIDLAIAKARYADSLRASEPQLVRKGFGQTNSEIPASNILKLVNARHPLLTGKVVPNSVEIGEKYQVLLITGPNTGGKTVTLKTIGLLTLMAQAGLAIPADDGSQVPVYDDVFADIGDEQSIEQSLSTFSSHMGNIISILREADENSLVLLDELGAGTDPTEGSALAQAVLTDLLDRNMTTIATTHHSQLKSFAHVTPGMKNASMEFDPETLAPTYRLAIGFPGRSNAIAIAARLGLPGELIERAKSTLSRGETELDSLLAEIQKERNLTREQHLAVEKARQEAERLQEVLNERIAELEERKEELAESAALELGAEIEELRSRLRRTAAEIEAREIDKVRVAVMATEVAQVEKECRRRRRQRQPAIAKPVELVPGTIVGIAGFKQSAELLSAPDREGMVDVRLGAFKLRVEAGRIRSARAPAPVPIRRTAPEIRLAPHEPPPLELNLRGKRVDGVAEEVDRYLNDAFLSGLHRIRILHGKGTGALRQAVREQLAAHPLVKSFGPAEQREGGDGVTVAELAV